ncbi:MAG: hypothetical protein L3J37_07280 [Rhodobacteraceae bacterium]|nr:hypothetical protein [Paracoccaceae bacterium]
MKPLLYFSYGMTKTGSTLAFQLVRSALDLCGYPQDRLELDVVDRTLRRNFVNHISDRQLEELKQAARKCGYPIVLKTHMRPDPGVVKMIQSGEAIAHAGYRDPRDMILSMLDHATRSRASGESNFAELTSIPQVLANIRHQFNTLTAWLRLPGTLPIYFEDAAFETEVTAQRILNRLKLSFDPAILADIVLNDRFTQKNTGKRLRYPREMDQTTAAEIGIEFAPFIERFITHRASLPDDGSIILPPPQQLRTTATG